jgi:hypothetical protein
MLGTFAQSALIQALRLAATNLVMPINFLRLKLGALPGFSPFRETPDGKNRDRRRDHLRRVGLACMAQAARDAFGR